MTRTHTRHGEEAEDDRTLIRRYGRDGSEEAFSRLMRRHFRPVYAVCRRDLGDASLAEDATQVAFLHLARKAPAPLPPGSTAAASPRSVLLKARLIERVQDGNGGVQREQVLAAPAISTLDGTEGMVRVGTSPGANEDTSRQWQVILLPHRNDDGTLRLKVSWSEEETAKGKDGGEESRKTALDATKRVRFGQKTRLTIHRGSVFELLLEVTAFEITTGP